MFTPSDSNDLTQVAAILAGKGGFDYKNIYKNLLREIRKSLSDEFEAFKITHKCKFKFRHVEIKDKFYPLQILEFTKHIIGNEMLA